MAKECSIEDCHKVATCRGASTVIRCVSRIWAKSNLIHGHNSGTKPSPTYKSWQQMRDRCNNPNAPKYHLYGGRGIVVCERWDSAPEGFVNFLADMGERPEDRHPSGYLVHSLDRKDVNGNYEPDNCYWATSMQQRHNRRDSVKPQRSLLARA